MSDQLIRKKNKIKVGLFHIMKYSVLFASMKIILTSCSFKKNQKPVAQKVHAPELVLFRFRLWSWQVLSNLSHLPYIFSASFPNSFSYSSSYICTEFADSSLVVKSYDCGVWTGGGLYKQYAIHEKIIEIPLHTALIVINIMAIFLLL